MSKITTATVKGADIRPSTEQVVKIGGRWYWITSRENDPSMRHGDFVMAVPQAVDPRYAQAGITGRRAARLRYIARNGDYPVRKRTAPVWEWVTKAIERSETR